MTTANGLAYDLDGAVEDVVALQGVEIGRRAAAVGAAPGGDGAAIHVLVSFAPPLSFLPERIE